MLINALIRGREAVAVAPDETVGRARRIMEAHAIRHLPVVAAGRRVVGVVSDRDILQRQARAGVAAAEGQPVREVMTPSPVVVRDDEDARRARRLMLRCGVGCLPVVDCHRALVGVVTRGDLLRAELPAGDAPAVPPDTARMLMQRPAVSAAADDGLLDAVARMEERGIRHLPVVDGDHHVIGMLSDRDVRNAIGDLRHAFDGRADVRLRALRVHHAMTRDPLVIREDAPFTQLVSAFTDQRVGAVPVVDAEARLVGIVSYVDVLRNAGAL
jgi:CBS domain-containing protein